MLTWKSVFVLTMLSGTPCIAADSLGNGAVLEHRPMGTAELMLMCNGSAPIAMDPLAQKIACLHYVQGFLDSHVLTVGAMQEVAERDPSIILPRRLTTCVDLTVVTASRLLGKFGERFGDSDAMEAVSYAPQALLETLLDNYPCVK